LAVGWRNIFPLDLPWDGELGDEQASILNNISTVDTMSYLMTAISSTVNKQFNGVRRSYTKGESQVP
jgi:hypothetical protein